MIVSYLMRTAAMVRKPNTTENKLLKKVSGSIAPACSQDWMAGALMVLQADTLHGQKSQSYQHLTQRGETLPISSNTKAVFFRLRALIDTFVRPANA